MTDGERTQSLIAKNSMQIITIALSGRKANSNPDKLHAAESQLAAMGEALTAAPILSKYHGRGGFDVERFITDYQAWKTLARSALSSLPARAKAWMGLREKAEALAEESAFSANPLLVTALRESIAALRVLETGNG
jgi:hypothetical protein